LDQPFTRSHRPHLPKEWIDANVPHSHKAIDDALGHALMFCNIVAANRKSKCKAVDEVVARLRDGAQ
jgi:hypothetical protein